MNSLINPVTIDRNTHLRKSLEHSGAPNPGNRTWTAIVPYLACPSAYSTDRERGFHTIVNTDVERLTGH